MEEMTLSRLREMKLAQMARRMEEIAGDPNSHSMAWRDAVASMVDTEYDHRSTRRLQELLRKARLKYPNANLESLDYDAARGLSKELMRELSSGRWIEQAHNILISGPTGTGKSYLACALAAFACRRHHGDRRVDGCGQDALSHAAGLEQPAVAQDAMRARGSRPSSFATVARVRFLGL